MGNNVSIFIGSDSQVYGSIVRYITAIVYKYGNRGAHYIFNMDEVPRMKDDFLRLYNEGSRTVETYEIISEAIPVNILMEFDYANIKKTLSSPLVGAFKGWPNARFKGGEMFSTKAADWICRNYGEITSDWNKENKANSHLRVA